MTEERYRILPGPEAYLAPAAALMGVTLPDSGGALAEGEIVPENLAVETIAKKLAEAKTPAVCPGPMLLWQYNDGASEKAEAVREMAEACGARIIPMIDYSAKRIRADTEISPNHPNVTLQHHNIDVCVLAGVHSHYANIALRLVRGRTSCYTIALDEFVGIDEAMVVLRDVDIAKIGLITEKIRRIQACR